MENERGIRKFIGDRAFYKMVLGVMLPIVLQNMVTSFVSLLDNIMVGQCGTAAMSGVAVVSQLMFNFMVIIFGTVSGPGIFCAQFFGAKDRRGMQAAFRLKLLLVTAVALVGMAVMFLWGDTLIGLFLTGEQAARDEVMVCARDYARVIVWMMIPFALSNAYASTLRETGQTVVPMAASVTAVIINLFLNWVLIFGKLGAPEMGVAGAAVATVVSRWAELAINAVYSHRHGDKLVFPQKLFTPEHMPLSFYANILKNSIPLFFNEFLWSTGTSVIVQAYSIRGLTVVAALNITYVVSDLFQMAAFSTGNTIGILVGQELGAGRLDKAVSTDRKLIAFGFSVAVFMAVLMSLIAPLFPRLYNTSDEVRVLACQTIWVLAAIMPFSTLAHASYFTLRSGGKTVITFVFDCGFMWAVNIPTAWCAAHLTAWPILTVFALSNSTDLIKAAIGMICVRRKRWVNNLTVVSPAEQ